MRIVYNETHLGYFKTFFPENLTTGFKTPYIATEKLFWFSTTLIALVIAYIFQ